MVATQLLSHSKVYLHLILVELRNISRSNRSESTHVSRRAIILTVPMEQLQPLLLILVNISREYFEQMLKSHAGIED